MWQVRALLVMRVLSKVGPYMRKYGICSVDTGHFFNTSLIQGLVFKGIVKGQESKVWPFFKGLRTDGIFVVK